MLRCLLIVFCLNISAQSVTEYYDAAQKQPKSTTSFSNGTPNGLHTEYSIDGSVLVSGWFKQGDMDSTWTHFYTNGTAKSIESYKNGFLNGPSTYYYKNKTIAQTTNHSKGVAEGEWKLFYENGSPQATEYYVKGKKQGEWTNYYKTGGPQSKYTYSNDILNGPYQEWHAGPNTNKIKCTGMFSFGQKKQARGLRFIQAGCFYKRDTTKTALGIWTNFMPFQIKKLSVPAAEALPHTMITAI